MFKWSIKRPIRFNREITMTVWFWFDDLMNSEVGWGEGGGGVRATPRPLSYHANIFIPYLCFVFLALWPSFLIWLPFLSPLSDSATGAEVHSSKSGEKGPILNYVYHFRIWATMKTSSHVLQRQSSGLTSIAWRVTCAIYPRARAAKTNTALLGSGEGWGE